MYTSTPRPEGEQLALLLADPIEAVWRGLDRGKAAADEFFETHPHRMYDAHMAAHIIRYEAQLSLKDAAHRAKDWRLERLSNGGIQIRKDGWSMRVFKTVDGTAPPAPGHSRARRNFWMQGFHMPTLFDEKPEGGNLILYWRVGSAGVALGLCKPRGVWRYRGSPKLAWRQPIEIDPLSGLRFSAPDEDIEVIRLDRLALGEEEIGG